MTADITILGLGIRGMEQVTPEAEAAIRRAREVLYLDPGLGTEAWLGARAARATPLFQTTYTEGAPRLGGYHDIAARVLEAALEHAPVALAIEGHPTVGLTAVPLIRQAAAALGLSVSVLPGISAFDCLCAALGVDPVVEGLMMVEATDLMLRRRPLVPDMPLVIWQAGVAETVLHTTRPSRPERFHRLAALLGASYPPDHPVVIFLAGNHPLVPDSVVEVPLSGLAGATGALGHGVTLYLAPVGRRPIVDAALLVALDDPAHLARITRQN